MKLIILQKGIIISYITYDVQFSEHGTTLCRTIICIDALVSSSPVVPCGSDKHSWLHYIEKPSARYGYGQQMI